MQPSLRVPEYQIMRKSHGFVSKRVEYERPGDGSADPHAGADLALTKRVAETLERHYPSHPWMVETSHAQGVVMISLPIIQPRNQKFILHIDRLKSDPAFRSVVRAGGEILERYSVPRAGFNLDAFLQARAANPMNRRTRLVLPS